MRFYLLVVLLFVAIGVQGQHKVTYLKTITFPNGVEHKDISTLYYTPEFIYEESILDNSRFGSILDAKSKNMHFVEFDGELTVLEDELLTDEKTTSREVVDDLVEVMGIQCHTLIETSNEYDIVYRTYFSNKYKLDYSAYAFSEYYTRRFTAMDGGIPMGFEYNMWGVEYSLRAIQIEKITKAEMKWLRSENRFGEKLAKNAEALNQLYERFAAKNGTESNANFQGNIEATGSIKIQNMQLPIVLNFSAPSRMMINFSMMGASLIMSFSEKQTWQYNGMSGDLNASSDVSKTLNLNPEDIALPRPDTVFSYYEYENVAYLSFWKNAKKQMATIDLETLFATNVYFEDDHIGLGSFELHDNIWLPRTLKISGNDMNGLLEFDNITISEERPASFFEIPDSLSYKLGETSSDSEEGDYAHAEAKLAEGEYAAAVALYKEALQDNPNSALLYNQIGFCELKLEEYYSAIASLGRAIEIDDQFHAAHANLAHVKQMLGDPEEALSSYTEAIDIQPKAEYYSKRGIVNYNLDKYDSALSDFQSAVLQDSTRRDDWFNIATSLYAMEAYAEAIPHYTKAIEMSPTARAYNDRGTSQYALEQYEFALNDFEKAVEMAPGTNLYRNNLGDTYGALGHHKSAIEQYSLVAKKDTSNAYIHFELGNEYMAIGDTQMAIAEFTHAIGIEDGEAAFFDARGAAYFEAMDYVAAIDDFSSSLTLYPDDGEIYYLRGMTKIYSSDIFDGCKDLNKAKALGSEKATTLMSEKCTFSTVDGG